MDNKKREKRNKIIAILYLLCSICWIISAIFNYKNSNTLFCILDVAFAAVWIFLGIVYFKKKDK